MNKKKLRWQAINAFLILIVFSMILANSFETPAQTDNRGEILVESWKQGKEKVPAQQIDVVLTSKNQEYQNTIFCDSGKKYKLLIKHISITEQKLSESGKSTESWKVELREILPNKKDNKELLGDNLLKAEGIGDGGDNFPREDLIGYLYLKENSKILLNGEPLIDGNLYYPIKSIRKIKVENFYVIIQVKDFRLNAQDNHKVDYLDLSIQLKPSS